MTGLLPLAEAQARLLAMAVPLPVEHVAIDDALGRFLTQPLIALGTRPTADLSAMDGYAVRSATLPGPWRVVGESAAGHPFAGTVGDGEAVRIATGALVPEGTDRVLIQEDCARAGDVLTLGGTPPPATNIRRRGSDFASGQVVLAAGAAVGAAQVGLAYACGHRQVAVRRNARIAIIESGDELAPPGAPASPHHIPASNGAMIAALLRAVPCRINRSAPVADALGALTQALADGSNADVIVTSGGASVGDHDLLRPALEAYGAEVAFWKVAIRPGKPLVVARKGSQVILGLPGNPAASFVTAWLFLLPLLRALGGAVQCLPARVEVELAGALGANGARTAFLRASWDGSHVSAARMDDSGAVAALAASNCLIERAAHAPSAAPGTRVVIHPFAPPCPRG